MKNIIFTTFLAILAIGTISAQDQGTKRKSKTHKKRLNKTEILRAYLVNCAQKHSYDYRPDSSYAPDDVDLVILMQDPAIDITAQDETGDTVLMTALSIFASENRRQCNENLNEEVILEGLDNPNLDINQSNNWGKTLLMLATTEYQDDTPYTASQDARHAIFDKILELEPDLNKKDKHGRDALLHAIQSDANEFQERLGWPHASVTIMPVRDKYYLKKLLAAGARVSKAHIKMAKRYVKFARNNLDNPGNKQKSTLNKNEQRKRLEDALFVLTLLNENR